MASQRSTRVLVAIGLIVVSLEMLIVTSNVLASAAELSEIELIGELLKSEHSSHSSLLPVEFRNLIASNKFIRNVLARQAGSWPFSAESQCSQSNTRDTSYNKNQDLTGKIDKLLNKYPRCGMSRLSATENYADDEPEEVFTDGPAAQPEQKRGKRSLRSRQPIVRGRKTQKSPQTRIFGGRLTRVGEWPWLAAIGSKDSGPQCGGTLIADRWILTAAHCFDDRETVCKYNVRLGARNWMNGDGTTPQDVDVDAIYRHPNYDGSSYVNDIALLKVASSVKMDDQSPINAVCLSKKSQPVPVGTICLAAGWGKLETNSTKTVLNSRQVDLPIVTYDDPCGDYNEGTLKPGMFCAGPMEGGKDTCQGDSGGPLIYKSDKRWTQIGVTSFGGDCGRARFPGVYTDVGYHLHWIASVITRYSDTLQ